MPDANNIKAHCNTCARETKHDLVAEDTEAWHDNDAGIEGSLTFEMIKCRGCGSVKLKRSEWFSAWDDYGEDYMGRPTWTPGIKVDYFPPAVSRSAPHWIAALSPAMTDLMGEIYKSLHADCKRLAVMGARTLIDMLLVDKVGDQGGFKDKLKRLESKGLISSQNRETLDAALEAGHAVSHRNHDVTASEVNDVMDIVENVLHASFITGVAAERLKKTTPTRDRK